MNKSDTGSALMEITKERCSLRKEGDSTCFLLHLPPNKHAHVCCPLCDNYRPLLGVCTASKAGSGMESVPDPTFPTAER